MTSRSPIIPITLLLIAGIFLTACGPATGTTQAPPVLGTAESTLPPAIDVSELEGLVIYNWSDYIDPEIYNMFQEEFGIEITEDNFSNNEELLAKLQGGAKGYAMIVPSDYTVSIMIEEGMLAKLNHDNIPNLSNLAERFKSLPYDPGNLYCAPYQWGTTGIGYLASEVDTPTSWAALFDPDPAASYYGRATMLDDVRESFAAALIYLGYDINTTDEAQLQEAKNLLIKAKAGLAGYDSDTFEDLVASGENLLAHGWNGDFLIAQEENEDLAYTIPQEGGVVWVDNICIPSSATPEQKAGAEKFINFLLRQDVGALLSEFNYYASPNAASEELLGEDFLSDPTVYPPADVLSRLQYIEPVGEFESTYQRLWDEVRSASVP